MAWATAADVFNTTGVSVSDDTISAAQIIIEVLVDVTEDSDAYISTKNLRLLKLAVVYQTAWITQHPDMFMSMDITTATQDGMAYSFAHAQAGYLAPLAKMCIGRLSWKRNRSVVIRRAQVVNDYRPQTLNTTNADLDDRRTDWKPLY